MSTNFHLQIPDVSGYEVEYYFSETQTEYPPRVFPFHLHDQMELYILLEGDVSFAVESSLYRLSPCDAIVTLGLRLKKPKMEETDIREQVQAMRIPSPHLHSRS